MPTTFTQIGTAQVVGSGGAASINFTSIPNTYTDLCVLYSIRVNSTNDLLLMSFNGVTTGYTNRWVYGNGSSASSSGNSGFERLVAWVDTTDNTASTFGNAQTYIPNYAGSTYKSYLTDFVSENNATGAEAGFMASLWSNTAAITSIKIEHTAGANILEHSTAYLYGVSNA